MRRIHLTDGTGRWFDLDRAARFEEGRTWDGRNWVSDATGSQWDHEELYQTASGKWVLHRWSQWEGSLPIYQLIGPNAAYDWLVRNGYADVVPPEALAAREV